MTKLGQYDMDISNADRKTKEWYTSYYKKQGEHRNDLLRNPEVAFQIFAMDAALIKSLGFIVGNIEKTRVLDVGCGNGASILSLLRLGFMPENLHGIDVQTDRIAEARHRLPSCQFTLGDASQMPFPEKRFDIVFESTMFAQITDDALAKRIAQDMVRVCRSGGHIVLSDWRYSKPFNANYCGLSWSRTVQLFQVGEKCVLESRHRSALLPPIGRWLSKYARPMYFICHTLFPFLSGHMVTVLRRI
jgi:ubiquinone/menaquinone biosynthesis C-methylase UbiE